MIGVCLNLFDDRSTIHKKLRDIAAGHFLKGVSSNQYFILTQAVLAALSTCIGEDDVAISSWKRIFTFFLRVMVPHARYLEGKCRISKALKVICGDLGRKKVMSLSKPEYASNNGTRETSVVSTMEAKERTKDPVSPVTGCPYHSHQLSRSTLYRSKYSANSIELDFNASQRRVRVASLVEEKDTREDEPSNYDGFILRNHE